MEKNDKQISVQKFNLEKAILEVVSITNAESVKEAGKELYNILSVEDVDSQKEMLARFYDFCQIMAEENQDALLQILKNSDVLKKIYTNSGTTLNENVDGVDFVIDETAYVKYFLKNDISDIVALKDKRLSDDSVYAGSVLSVLLRVIYDGFLANIKTIERTIERKERMTSSDYSEEKKKAIKSIQKHFFKSLKEIKKNIFSSDYFDVVSDLRDFLDSSKKASFEDIGTLVVHIKELKADLDAVLAGKTFDVPVVEQKTDYEQHPPVDVQVVPENKSVPVETDEIIEEITTSLKNEIFALRSEIVTKKDIEVIESQLRDIDSSFENIAIPANGNKEEKISFSIEEKLDEAVNIIKTLDNESLEISIDALQKNIASLMDSVSGIGAGLANITEETPRNNSEEFQKIIEKIENINKSTQENDVRTGDNSGHSDDEQIAIIKNSLSNLSSEVSDIKEENNKILNTVSSLSESIEAIKGMLIDEIENSKKIRKDFGYEN